MTDDGGCRTVRAAIEERERERRRRKKENGRECEREIEREQPRMRLVKIFNVVREKFKFGSYCLPGGGGRDPLILC